MSFQAQSKISQTLCTIIDLVEVSQRFGKYPIESIEHELTTVRRQRIRSWRRAELAILRRAERKELVCIERRKDAYFVALTQKGEVRALWERIRWERRTLPEGQYCYVFFDIPERVRAVRDAFRRSLRLAGFVQIQRSVWCLDRQVADDLKFIVHLSKLDKWVTVVDGIKR